MSGKTPVDMEAFKISHKGLLIIPEESFSIDVGILFGPVLFIEFIPKISYFTSLTVAGRMKNDFSLGF